MFMSFVAICLLFFQRRPSVMRDSPDMSCKYTSFFSDLFCVSMSSFIFLAAF